ncbi:putative c6 zinc finger domain-containing protein [Phaeoacremonium minimum UCRPA7]|uniref:Putative c6 zinc finger domain-containing protein n=1 Tax=Phaeoacremonium minimum (strain UCR-PA7) TaxID=1286976 RepID=R8BLG1_PHAM7|nr:putative c6 zinc finger domain-containing protein [Phaeoacremonium minimum UCRPA7]EOO00226.1 putative c6 zinc finger domain-containing protein [Phaeoacremonium minimum UCRPA7]
MIGSFKLSAALVSGNRVPLEKLQLVQPQWNDSSMTDSIYQYTREPLMLCARAINFIAGDVSSPATEFPIPLAQAWRHIAEELGAWYTNRPEEFQPIVELDLDSRAGERLFPTVLFTNGAAVLANQLYHTAMMILLQHKPRTLVLDSRRSSAVSPLWHAQRVCGIALNNDRRECWDLSLVSSLFVAAKKMTYEPQQREILRRFDAIARVTGWNIGRFSSMLRDEWDISDKG